MLRGPSGSGKSTWLALAAALVPLRAGYLQAAGQDLAALSRVQADAWRARNLGFLPQTLHLSAALTVAAAAAGASARMRRSRAARNARGKE